MQSAILVSILGALSFNIHAAPCDTNFSSSGSFITGTTYKTFADLPNTNVANAYEGALADIAKEPSWKILAQDKNKGMIQAVQAAQYDKGKVIPLNINIVPAGSGAKMSMDYVTPTGSLSPASAVKSQFCKTIAAAENGVGANAVVVAENGSVNPQTSTPTVTSAPPATSNQAGGMSLSEPQKKQLKAQINLKTKDNLLKIMIAEAKPTIEKVLEMQACFYPSHSYGLYKSDGGNHFYVPDGSFSFHNKLECVNVQRVKDWKMIANNAFRFNVVYVAEDSGQSAQMGYEMQKQPDGVWLFNKNNFNQVY